MANQITGKVIAIGNPETIQGNDPSKQPMVKRKLFIDCTRYNPYTGERGYENTPLLEFGGRALDKLNELVEQGLKKDDIVVVSFDIQGRQYEDKNKKKQVFTAIRPYDIELFKTKNNQEQPPVSAPQPNGSGQDNDLPF